MVVMTMILLCPFCMSFIIAYYIYLGGKSSDALPLYINAIEYYMKAKEMNSLSGKCTGVILNRMAEVMQR